MQKFVRRFAVTSPKKIALLKKGELMIRIIYLVVGGSLGYWIWGTEWETWIKVVAIFFVVAPMIASALS